MGLELRRSGTALGSNDATLCISVPYGDNRGHYRIDYQFQELEDHRFKPLETLVDTRPLVIWGNHCPAAVSTTPLCFVKLSGIRTYGINRNNKCSRFHQECPTETLENKGFPKQQASLHAKLPDYLTE